MGQRDGSQYSSICLSGARGCPWLRPAIPGLKWCCFLRTRLQWCLPGIREPPGVTASSPYCVVSRGGSTMGRQVVKSCLPMTVVIGKRTGTNHS
jgi:hypothetical protein